MMKSTEPTIKRRPWNDQASDFLIRIICVAGAAVGKLVCELSLDDDGRVQTRWFDGSGRMTEPPMYLDAADCRQYRAAREAFLRAAGKPRARLRSPTGTWHALRRLATMLAVAALLAGCESAQEIAALLVGNLCRLNPLR